MNHMTTQLGGGWGTICLIECVTEGGGVNVFCPIKHKVYNFTSRHNPQSWNSSGLFAFSLLFTQCLNQILFCFRKFQKVTHFVLKVKPFKVGSILIEIVIKSWVQIQFKRKLNVLFSEFADKFLETFPISFHSFQFYERQRKRKQFHIFYRSEAGAGTEILGISWSK